jgi:ribosomal protein S21
VVVVKPKPGETADSLIRRFRKISSRVVAEYRDRERYKKPSRKKYEDIKRKKYAIELEKEKD